VSLIDKLKSDLEGIQGVDFEDVGEIVKVTVEYMPGKEGKDRWTTINKVVKQYGGDWIPLGRDSHWKVPKVLEQTQSEQRLEDLIREGIIILKQQNEQITELLKRFKEMGY